MIVKTSWKIRPDLKGIATDVNTDQAKEANVLLED